MQNNIFLGGSDPLLSSSNYETQIAELQRMQQTLEQQRKNMEIAQQQMQSAQSNPTAPIWNEIETITSELTDKEFDYISNNEEFAKSQQKIAELINEEYLKMMRPIVERTQKGRNALEEHLVLLKNLRKSAIKENEKNLALFNEYISTNPDISFKEFINLKGK